MGIPLDTEPAEPLLEGITVVPSSCESIRKMEAVPSLSKLISDAQSARWGLRDDRTVIVLKGTLGARTGFFVGIFSADKKRIIVAQHLCYTHPMHLTYDWSRYLVSMLINSEKPLSEKNIGVRDILSKLSKWREDHYDVSRMRSYPPRSDSAPQG